MLVGSGALTQGSTHLIGFSADRKDQNASIHQKPFGDPQTGLRVAWYHYRDEI